MKAQPKFKIAYSDEAIEFLNKLDEKARAKILFNINKSKYVLDKALFKKLETPDDIWEFRTLYSGISYRLFAFWDTSEDALVIATHGIIKKSQKTPNREIKRAIEIKKLYFKLKSKRNG